MQKQQLKHSATLTSTPNGSPRTLRRVVTEAYLRSADPTVTTEDIRRRAYQIWISAGKPAGDGIKFWLAAEQELKQPN